MKMENTTQAKGPQLSFDKCFLFMKGPLDTIQQDKIVVKNHGSTTITYEWKKVQRGDHIAAKKSDFLQRFYCHYPRSILKPGESKTFTFSFRSEKVGMFNEEWELLTEPLLLNSLPMLSLSGISLQADLYAEKRVNFWQNFEEKFVQRDARETVYEVLGGVKTPEQDQLNLKDPIIFAAKFEEVNRDLELKFTKSTMENFQDLLDDIAVLHKRETGLDLFSSFTWSLKVGDVEKLIYKIQNAMSKQMILERYIKLVAKARKTPNERAHSFEVIRKMVGNLAVKLVEHETKVREEMGAAAIEIFRVPPEEETEEQRLELIKQAKLAQQESLKKLKKKPKTDEEEAKELEDINSKVLDFMIHNLVHDQTELVEREIELVKTKWLMNNHLIMNREMFDTLNRKVSILDIDFAEQEVILRADLDIPLSPFVPMPPLEEEFRHFFDGQADATKDSGKSKKKKKNKKQLEEEAEQVALLEQAKKLRSEPWKQRQILDHRFIKRTSAILKHLQEHLAKRVIVLGSIGERSGRVALENSMRILINPLQHAVNDIQVQYLGHETIGNIEKVEELKENVVYVMENLNFLPDENSYVAPWVEPELENKKEQEEEKKQSEETSQKQIAAAKNEPPKDPKKMSAAEKKKFDEDAKKKAEEDSKAAATLSESQETQEQRARREEQEKQKALARQKRLEEEYFDAKTTYKYLYNLGKQLGTLYVNDAPLACLSTSNSVAEIRCDRKVMGMKMTEEVRKLAQFFLKKYPLSVKERHIKQPEYRDYYDVPFAAILGGSCRNVSDLIDKILLANSLLDNASTIYLVGEIGIAAAAALGVEVSRVERFASEAHQRKEYAEVKPFFIRLFEKAAEQGVKVQIPVDYVTSPPLNLAKQELNAHESVHVKQETHEEKSGGSKLKAPAKDSLGKDSALQVHHEEQQQVSHSVDNSQERAIQAANPNMHWTDVMILAKKSRVIDLRMLIQSKMKKIVAKHRASVPKLNHQQTAEHSIGQNSIGKLGSLGLDSISRLSPSAPNLTAQILETNREEQEEDSEDNNRSGSLESKTEKVMMNTSDFVLQYGPETMLELAYLLAHSFKVFWDGSISLHKDTICSSTNNKEFLNKLLDIRMASDQHQEPPVTLIHGHETEVTLRETLMRIKVEQQEEMERMKQKALEQDDESLNEDEQDIVDVDESKEEISTFQEDMDTIADFLVSDSTQFTTKLLQGVPIRAMYSFDEHRKQSPEEQKEALDLLELI